ncbi:GNAT family N-acetyltransferase [Tamlana sp. PT2-4]|uniref:GNAT family N-acetyltransferase n=1 Tax=Neotamlana laminarinivorans TaxID=2883124 RepID=A0A9X1L2A9_9FLAO|nr:GNAT family N-acetyltransferase [Tamlana laminarinivorans]
MFDGDTLETTFHFGIFLNNQLLGICSLFKNEHKNLSDAHQYQLRGMAVLAEQQGKGLGKLVLNYAESFIKAKGITTIWCNAREVATKFYTNLGYEIFGEPFEIEKIGTHYAMYKPLQ